MLDTSLSSIFELMLNQAPWASSDTLGYSTLERPGAIRRFRVRNPNAPPVTEATKELMSRRRAALRDDDRRLYKDLNRRVRAAVRRDTSEDLRRRIQTGGRSSM